MHLSRVCGKHSENSLPSGIYFMLCNGGEKVISLASIIQNYSGRTFLAGLGPFWLAGEPQLVLWGAAKVTFRAKVFFRLLEVDEKIFFLHKIS